MQTTFYKCLFINDGITPDFILLFLVHIYKISFELFYEKETINTKFKREKNGKKEDEENGNDGEEVKEGSKQSSLGKTPWAWKLCTHIYKTFYFVSFLTSVTVPSLWTKS